MKRYLLFIISMLCVSIGTWADVTITWDSGTNTAMVSSTSSDVYFPYSNYWGNLQPNYVFTGNYSSIDWANAASKVYYYNSQTNARYDISGGATGISIENLSTLISSQESNQLDYVTRFVLPAGTAIPSDVAVTGSALNHGGKLQYVYVKGGSGKPSVYLTSNVTAASDLSYEFTEAEIEIIKEKGITLSGNKTAIDVIATYLEERGVESSKITRPYTGVAVATAGSVESDVVTSYTTGGGTATDVTTLTVNAGTLSDADVTYITGTLKNLTSLDISAATATGDQIFNLLSGTPAGCTITLSDAQKTALKATTEKKYTTAMLAKAGFSATSFMSGMTTKNYIISGTTLYVTGKLASGDASTIQGILNTNSSITTLDVSKCTNNSGDPVNITDAGWLSSNITTVSIPSGEYIKYEGSHTTVTTGSAIINIPTTYDTIADAVASTDLQSLISGNRVDYLKVTGTLTSEDLANLHSLGSGTGFSSVKSIDVSSVTLASGAEWTSISQNNASWGNASVLMPRGTDVTAFENCMANVQSISVDGQTLSIQVNDATKLTNDVIAANNSGASKLIVYDGKSSAAGSAAITALRQFEGFHLLDMTHAADQSATLTVLTNFDIVLSPISSGKLTVLGTTLTNEMLQTISALTSNITAIDFSNVTNVASDLDWNNLTASAGLSGLASLTLPKGTELTTAEARKLTTNFSSLMYAYSPTTKNRTRAEQDVADYVYVIRPGGLNQAMTDESDLRKAVYVKIVSDVGNNVALSPADAKFGGHNIILEPTYSSVEDYPWQFIDLSGTIVTAAATIANTAPYTDKGYRIILPSNLTGDNMAIFASKPVTDDGKDRGYRGIPAAVYSYKGTTLNILEIADGSYLPTALADGRIVRDGTTEVSVISGVFGSDTYFNFGDNLRKAINGAKSCVETVTIEVPYTVGWSTLTIDNKNLKTISFEGVNNPTVSLNVDGCNHLETLNLNEATFSKATAQGIKTLKEVDLRNTTFGTKDTSTGAGCINLTGSLNDGLKITLFEEFELDRIIPSLTPSSPYLNKVTQADLDVTCEGNTLQGKLPAVLTAKEKTDGKTSGTYTNRDVTVLHVTGTLTSADVNFIVNNLHRLELLDLKGASYGDGVTGETLVNALYSNSMSDIALIFPTNNTTAGTGSGTVNQHEVWYATTSRQMKCVGYYTDAPTSYEDLHIYGVDGNVAKIAKAVPTGDTQFALSFLPSYQADPYGVGALATAMPANNYLLYPSAQATFVTEGLHEIPANTIDLTWMNASTIRDLSALNDNTHFVIVPQNSNAANDANDFSITNAEGGYRYNTNVWGVSSYKGKAAPYSTQAYFTGRQFDFSTANGTDESALLMYVTASGKTHITPVTAAFIATRLPAVDRIVVAGEFNATAFSALNGLSATKVDLSKVTLEEVDLRNYANASVEYLALPCSGDVSQFVPSSFKTGSPNLKAVGLYHEGSDTSGDVANKLYLASWEAGSVRTIVEMIHETATIGSYKMWGPLNHEDISNGNIANGAFYRRASTMIKSADLSMAWFPNPDHMNFSTAGAYGSSGETGFSACQLPRTNMTIIPEKAFENMQALTTIAIPDIYTTFKEKAFHLCTSLTQMDVYDITTSGETDLDGVEFGSSGHTSVYDYTSDNALIKEVISNGSQTVTLPASLGNGEDEGLYTESMQLSEKVKDIYVLATTAPRCQADAFGSVAYVGNNTFAGVQAHPFARDKYRMSFKSATPEEETKWIAMLHFPAETSPEEAANYTDLTRNYSLYDEEGNLDGEGNPIRWPNQGEMLRSFNQARTGVTWGAWAEERDANNEPKYGTWNTATPDLGNSPAYDSEKYMGWHQFVLCASYVAPITEPTTTTIDYEQTNWYTICLPYNMTKEQVVKYLGIPASAGGVNNQLNGSSVTEDMLPDIRTMVGVTRTKKKDAVKNKITIHLSKNLSKQPKDITVGLRGATYTADREDQSGSTSADDKDLIYLKGGYPYFIKAYLPTSVKSQMGSLSLGALTMMRITKGSDAATILNQPGNKENSAYTNNEDVLAPKVIDVQAYYINGESHYFAKDDDTEDADEALNDNDFIYGFEGQYWEQYLPLGCYYLAADQNFYRATTALNGNDPQWSMWTWKPYVAVITPKLGIVRTSLVKKDNSYMRSYSETFTAGDDSFAGTSWARSVELVFDEDIIEVGEDQTTSLDELNGISIAPTYVKVYNMAGQYVGDSVDGLAKGMYIVNGKKVVVK